MPRPENDPRSITALENLIYRRIARGTAPLTLDLRQVTLAAFATAKTL